jgi:DNA-binding response OmpR family regulator
MKEMAADPFKILLVDDTPANLDLLVDYLTRANFEVFVAENGQSALDRLRYLQPDLILLDVLMPGISGFEVCKTLKTNFQTRHIPVIFLSAREETADKIKGFTVGGVDYITKPLEEAEVVARVRTHLQLAHTHRRLREENYRLQRHLAQQRAPIKQHLTTTVPSPLLDASMVRLTLLGAFQLSVDGEIRTGFRSDTVRALLAYLVLEGHTPLERAALAAFFWPDYLPATQLNSLRVALHNLRQLLTPYDGLVIANRKELRFRQDDNRLWCDALAWEADHTADFSPGRSRCASPGTCNAPTLFLPDFDTVASAPFQRWRQQQQAFYALYGATP